MYGVSYTPTITTSVSSAGGSEKESIESIKANAPIVFASQQRLVTAEDYKAIISQRFSTLIDDVAAWGGEDNIPATFGDVYLSLNFKTGIAADVQTNTKNTIQNVVAPNLGIMSIDAVFVDPINTFIELAVTFDFDPDLTNLTIDTIQSNIKTEISSFFTSNLGKFGDTFRRSQLLTTIDALSPAILNSDMTVKVQQSFVPTLNTAANYDVDFPIKIAAPDDENHVVTSTPFTIGGNACIIRNRLSSTSLEVFDQTNAAILLDNIGSYNQSTGKLSLTGFGTNVTAFTGSEIKISITPANQNTIKPLRNYILNLDVGKTSASGTIDFQNTTTTLTI